MDSADSISKPQGPPYAPPRVAGLGGIPTVHEDIPVAAILLVVYLGFLAWNFTTFRSNRTKGHKFLISWFLTIFSWIRVITCSLRIAWAVHHDNVRLVMAAQIFTNAGILIIWLVNLNFALRITRAMHPKLGWHSALHWVVVSLYTTIGLVFIMMVVTIILSFYTLDEHTKSICATCQKVTVAIFVAISASSMVLLLVAVLLPSSRSSEQHFGTGSLLSKIIIVAASASISTTIAGFKCGVIFMQPRPVNDPPWYDSKPSYYCFLYVTEILILAIFASTRIDKRFHVPNGSSKLKSYESEVSMEKV